MLILAVCRLLFIFASLPLFTISKLFQIVIQTPPPLVPNSSYPLFFFWQASLRVFYVNISGHQKSGLQGNKKSKNTYDKKILRIILFDHPSHLNLCLHIKAKQILWTFQNKIILSKRQISKLNMTKNLKIKNVLQILSFKSFINHILNICIICSENKY